MCVHACLCVFMCVGVGVRACAARLKPTHSVRPGGLKEVMAAHYGVATQ